MHKVSQFTGHNGSIFALAPYQTPHTFLSAAGDGWIVGWDTHNPDRGKLLAQVPEQIFALTYLPDTHEVVAGNMNGGLHWIPLDHPEHTKNIAVHTKGLFALLRQGDYLYSAGGDGMLHKWSVTQKRSLESLSLSGKSIRCLIADPEKAQLIAGSSDGNIYFVDPENMTVTRYIAQAHQSSVFSLCLIPGTRQLLSGGRDAMLRRWDIEDQPKAMEQLPAHWFTLNDIRFQPGGDLLATASRDKTIKIWQADDLQLVKVLEGYRDQGHLNSVNALYWQEDGRTLFSASDDRTIIAWSL